MNANVKKAVKVIREARAKGWTVRISTVRLYEGRAPLFTQVSLFLQLPKAFMPARHIIFMFKRRGRRVTVATESGLIYGLSSKRPRMSKGTWSAAYLLNHP